MAAQGRRLYALLGVVVTAVFLLAGCPGPQQPAGPGAASAPASAPASKPALPARAAVHLDDLQPPIEKVASPTTQPDVPARVLPLLNDGKKMINARDFAGAVNSLERAVGYDPQNPHIRRALAFAYAGLNDRGRAEDNIRRALAAMPDDLDGQLLLGELAVAGKKNAQAITALRTALQCSLAKPQEAIAAEALLRLAEVLDREEYLTASADAYTLLGEWLDKHGANYGQRAALRQLLLRPEQLLGRRGAILLRLGRHLEAADLLERAYTRDRTDAGTASLLMQSLLENKSYARAEKIIREMVAEPVQRRSAPPLIEAIIRATGDANLPLRLWQNAMEKRQADEGLGLALSKISETFGATNQAVTILDSLLQTMPDSGQAARALTVLYSRLGKGQEGLGLLVRALASNPAAQEAISEAIVSMAASLPLGFEKTYAAQNPAKPEEAFAFHYVAGRLAQLRAQQDLALEQYAKSLAAHKDFAPATEGMLEIYLDQAKIADAQKLVELLPNPKGSFAEYAQGRLLLAGGKEAEGVAALERARAANPRHVPTLLLLADSYMRRGTTGEAKEVLRAAIEASGRRIDVYRRVVEVLVARREFAEAADLLASLQRQAPSDTQVQALAADFKLVQEIGSLSGVMAKADYDRIAARLNELIQADPQHSQTPRQYLAELQFRLGRYDAAAETLRPLFEASPKLSDISKLYADSLMLAKKYEAAAEVLEKIMPPSLQDMQMRRVLLGVLDKLKRYDHAIELAKGWLVKASANDRFDLRARLMALYESDGKFDESLKVLAAMTADAGDDTRRAAFVQERIRLLVAGKKFEDANAMVQDLTAAEPQDLSPRQALIRALGATKQYDLAATLLDTWMAADPNAIDNTALRMLKLAVFIDANDPGRTQAYTRKWIQDDPENELPRRYLLGSLVESEKYDEALKLAETWLAESAALAAPKPAANESPVAGDANAAPVPATAPATKPVTAPATAPATGPASKPAVKPVVKRPRLPRPPRNGPANQAAPAADANRPGLSDEMLMWCRTTIVRVMMMKQDYAGAYKRNEEFLTAQPNDQDLLGLKSTCLAEMGKRKEALAVLEDINTRWPDTPLAQNNLSYAYADLGIELEKAEKLIRLALEDGAGEIAYEDTMGWVLYKQGHIREAATRFEEILRQENPDKPLPAVILDHAADAYARLGWLDRAEELWKRSLELAQKEKVINSEVRDVKANVPKKLAALAAKQPPPVSPLGEGVKEAAGK